MKTLKQQLADAKKRITALETELAQKCYAHSGSAAMWYGDVVVKNEWLAEKDRRIAELERQRDAAFRTFLK